MNEDLKIILAHIEREFTRKRNTRYWILVANDPFDTTFNFFFNSQPIGHRLHSVPLHTVRGNLEDLEQLIGFLQQKVNFSIEFTGFSGMRWPRSWRMIQREKRRVN